MNSLVGHQRPNLPPAWERSTDMMRMPSVESTMSLKPAPKRQPEAGSPSVDRTIPTPGVYGSFEAATPGYLTPEQVASMMQVSPKTVYRMVATDASLPATRFGRAVRFRADLLERWLAAHTQRSRRLTADQRGGLTTSDTSTAA